MATIAGLVQLAAPNSLLALKCSVWTYIAVFISQMPANPNHRWVLFLVALSFASRMHSIRTIDPLASSVRASLRWLTIVVYLFAALAKLNTSYFDPTISCASVFSSETFGLYGMSPVQYQWLPMLIASFSTVAEVLIPLMLIWPRGRRYGIVFGVLFHIFLALNFVRYFGNFSAAMFILLASWLPEESCAKICSDVRRYLSALLRVWTLSLAVVAVLSVTSLLPLSTFIIVRHVIFSMFAGLLLFLVAKSVRGSACDAGVGKPSLVLIALAVLNALTPYAGIKTRSALTMYSNLRIEPGYSNHFLMPSSPDPLGYLSDHAEILSTSHQGLQERLQLVGTRQMPYLSLCAFMACQDELCTASHASQKVSYVRNRATTAHDLNQPLPADCAPWIARKLLFFGPVGPNSERACLW